MGAACSKDKSVSRKQAGGPDRAGDRGDPRHANNGASAGAAPGGGNVAANAGRPAQRIANEKVNENKRGACAGAGSPNNNGKAAANNNGGIASYKPDGDMAKLYFDRINELRSVAVATGIMPATEGDGDVDSTCNNPSGNFADMQRASACQFTSQAPPSALTVYQCQPLVGDTVVAKGMYSSVHLARLSVFVGPSEAVVRPTVPRHPAARRASDRSSISFSSDPASPSATVSNAVDTNSVSGGAVDSPLGRPTRTSDAVAHYIIAMKEVTMYASYSNALLLDILCAEVRHWTRLSAYSTRVLRCYQLEYVYADSASSAVPDACCQFYEGLPNGEEATTRAGSSSPSGGKSTERKKGLLNGNNPHLFTLAAKARNNGGASSLSSTQPDVAAAAVPQKLRVYLEYAKYGTLRGYQTKEVPERYQRRRLHELTTRAYMRDVLLALLELHDCGELQYDLCAKVVFMHRPIQMVYHTAFPAYISDVPAGDLASVTPTQLGKAMGQLDPLLQPANGSGVESPQRRGAVGQHSQQHHHNTNINEPIAGSIELSGHGAVAGTAASPNGGCGMHTNDNWPGDGANDISVMTNDASVGQQISKARQTDASHHHHNGVASPNADAVMGSGQLPNGGGGTGAGTNSNSSGYILSPDGARISSSQSGPVVVSPGVLVSGSPQAHGLKTHGSLSSMRTGGFGEGSPDPDDAANNKRLNDIYRRYMEEYDFKPTENDVVPFPSPHDGIEAQADAELIATTMLPEEPRETPPLHVVPLQRSALGGIAIISPDHYVVKPEVTLQASDLRGRLPMLLSPSTKTSALVFGSPHTTPPTYTSAVAQVGPCTNAGGSPSSSLQTHVMSAGTTTTDAAGTLGRARGGVPLTKLNHTSLIRRAIAYGDADKLQDIPVHKYVTVTHAAPEVLHRRAFSTASDIYAFAMTFIELVTDDGNILEECMPQDLPKPKTRREKDAYDAQLTANLDKWYQGRLNAMWQHLEAVTKDQELPEAVSSPRAGPIVMRVPDHLSDEARNMLRWCLQHDPKKRPSAAELLRSRYFMLGDWIAAPAVAAAEAKVMKLPEEPWDTSMGFDAAARAVGLPVLGEK